MVLVDLFVVIYYVVLNGEEVKMFCVYEDVMIKLIEIGFDCKVVLIVFGGGVIGDLGGFVVVMYMRGIFFY